MCNVVVKDKVILLNQDKVILDDGNLYENILSLIKKTRRSCVVIKSKIMPRLEASLCEKDEV